MRVLVVQNFRSTGLGQLGDALREAGAHIDRVVAFEGEALPSGPDGHDAIVVLGGGQNALDDAGSPWLPQLMALMREFVESGRSALGICLGSQLMARAYGADNLIGASPEFGWQQVMLTPEGRDDPVLAAAGSVFKTFQWHDDTFTLPRGAVRLAGNDAAHNQAFRIGRAGYAIQFHFEADRKLVNQWSIDFSDWLVERQPDWESRRQAESMAHGREANAVGRAIATAWVGTIRPMG